MGEFAKRMKIARLKSGFTTRDVYQKIGVSNISRYETGACMPSFSTVVRLARLYDVDIAILASVVK